MKLYPFAPLAALMGLSENAAVIALGLGGGSARRYRAEGMSELVADRLACRAGFHPFVVWPEMAADVIADVMRVCDQCAGSFWPWRRDQRFCGRRCARSWWSAEMQRRRRRRDPEWAERDRQRKRAYYEECGDAVRAQTRRRYYERNAS